MKLRGVAVLSYYLCHHPKIIAAENLQWKVQHMWTAWQKTFTRTPYVLSIKLARSHTIIRALQLVASYK